MPVHFIVSAPLRKQLLLPFLLLLLLEGQAQDRKEAWLRVNLVHWYTPQKGIGLELHQRMQSNYWTADKNPFEYPMLSIVRPWLYWKGKRNWTLSYSPLSYHGYTNVTGSSGQTKNYTEIRTTIGLQKNLTIGPTLSRHRAWYELRFIDVSGEAFQFATRLRIQHAFIVPLWKPSAKSQWGYQLSNEFFWALQEGYIGFDHNRLYNALQWRVGKQEINLGYQWSLHKNGSDFYSRRQLFINTSFDL
jgi:hypothetical protein